ncbi:LacI family DNA-binding transcriptional regulator [Enterovirga aerilata]|nr:LacI family DNA-binding transcriptional regulator [Enterovirga sp. DB1703]
MSDVAQLAGVSPMSVSNTYKQPAKVSPETRQRVFEAAAKLGYLPNLLAGTLASGRSRIVGAIVPSLRNSNFAGMIQGLEETLGQHGCELMLAVADDPERELRAVQAFLGRRLDGIVLTGIEHSPEVAALLRRADVPVVETWSLNGPFIDMGVGFSLFDAAFEMVQMMVQKGYRRIGFAGYNPPGNPRFAERQKGFEAALRQAGLRDDLLYFGPEALGFATGRLALEALLSSEPKLDGLFCVTDVLAAGAIFDCARRGWPVPDRLAVAGYGDYDIAAELTPGLTTVRTPGHAMGSRAATLILASVETGRPSERIIDVGYELVIRDSI